MTKPTTPSFRAMMFWLSKPRYWKHFNYLDLKTGKIDELLERKAIDALVGLFLKGHIPKDIYEEWNVAVEPSYSTVLVNLIEGARK